MISACSLYRLTVVFRSEQERSEKKYPRGSYADGSVATGRAFRARQAKGDNTDKKDPGSPGSGLGVRLTSPHKNMFVEKLLIV